MPVPGTAFVMVEPARIMKSPLHGQAAQPRYWGTLAAPPWILPA
jgi:hypothetical protein